MATVVLVVHVCVCLFLIFVVLLQRGKGADMGAVFGGSTNTILGASGAVSLLQKITTWSAILFMCTSLFLAWHSSYKPTVLDGTKVLKTEKRVDEKPSLPAATVPDEKKVTGEKTIPKKEGTK